MNISEAIQLAKSGTPVTFTGWNKSAFLTYTDGREVNHKDLWNTYHAGKAKASKTGSIKVEGYLSKVDDTSINNGWLPNKEELLGDWVIAQL